MKRLLATVALLGWALLACLSVQAGEYGTQVPLVSTMVLGAVGREGPDFAISTAYTAGTRVKSNNTIFFALATGTSGTTNSLTAGTDFFDGGLTWRSCIRNIRVGMAVQNLGLGNVSLAWVTSGAVTNRGIVLSPGGIFGVTGTECPQGAVYAISSTGSTNDVRTTEW